MVRPYMMLLIPILITFVLWSSRYMAKMPLKRKRNILILRSILFTLLTLILCGISIKWNIRGTTNLFVLDLSDSAKNFKGEGEKFIRESIEKMPKRNKAGVISFGENSLMEQFITDNKSFNGISSLPVQNATNIENAITSALAVMPQNYAKRIILLTDGEENEGSAEKIIPSLIQQNVDFKVYKIDKSNNDEVYIDQVSIPERIHIGEAFNISVNLNSNVMTSAKISLFSGRTKKGEMRVAIQKGKNRFVFKDTQQESGLKSYKVVIEPDQDTEVKNNEFSAFTNVQSRPRILLIEGASKEGNELERILAASKAEYKKVNSAGAPRTINEMTEFKVIITANVHVEDLNKGFQDNLESYVKDYAGGFVAVGGEDSFALGGYKDTPLEKVLPVYMDMRGKKEVPEMSLVLVIDHSGSMSSGNGYINKLELAKEAAAKAVDTLRAKDSIGVLAFDESYDWVLKPQKAADKKKLKDKIGTITIRGGTSIYPALEQGYKAQKDSKAKIKHVILLTDGQDGNRQYDELLKKMNDDKITLSTVSVGDDADKHLMKKLSEIGKGRYYHTDLNTNIPRIFAKEIFMSTRNYLNHREFVPKLSNPHPILNGVVTDNKIPTLLGYIGASPKEIATTILKSDEDDPILTVWQYGLGKTAAWNSDMSGKWSANYVQWDKNLKLWQNIINWCVENYGEEEGTAHVTLEGKKAKIEFTTKNQDEKLKVKAIYSSEIGEKGELNLYPTEPGKYSGSIDLKETGVYAVNIRQEENGKIINSSNTAVIMQYSPEYKFPENNNLLENMVNETAGKFIKSPNEIFKENLKSVADITSLTPLLLLLTLIIFVLDIAYRKLKLDWTNLIRKYLPKFNIKLPEMQKEGSSITIEKVQDINTTWSETEDVLREEPPKLKEKAMQQVKKTKNIKRESQTLDTTSLLKKKRDRTKK